MHFFRANAGLQSPWWRSAPRASSAEDAAKLRADWPAGVTSGRRRNSASDPLPLADLRAALAASGVRNHYQPIVRVADKRPLGLEVLVRLPHASLGLLAPDAFVPQFEDAGHAWELTQAVVRAAFGEWNGARLRQLELSLAVNFPLDLLLLPAALAWFDEQRQAAGIAATQLTIELTESQPVTRIAELRAAVAGLRGAGYGVAIDDVGPGVRDHRALLDMDFSALKLDKDLVRGSRDDAETLEFLLRAVAAARASGLVLVAEGVEDAEVWDRIERLGVEQAQGFLIARPMPADAVPGWHRDWSARHRPEHGAPPG